jgi:hypothetical protein
MVNRLTRSQVVSIVKEADQKAKFNDAKIDRLHFYLNSALVGPVMMDRLEVSPRQTVKALTDIGRAVRHLHMQLKPKYVKTLLINLQFLERLEAAIKVDPKHDSYDPQKSHDSVDALFRSVELANKSLGIKDVERLVALKDPVANIPELMRSTLPKIFELFFKRSCGNSHEGPGTRFIQAVLREAGIRTPQKKLYSPASIVKCRFRRHETVDKSPD